MNNKQCANLLQWRFDKYRIRVRLAKSMTKIRFQTITRLIQQLKVLNVRYLHLIKSVGASKKDTWQGLRKGYEMLNVLLHRFRSRVWDQLGLSRKSNSLFLYTPSNPLCSTFRLWYWDNTGKKYFKSLWVLLRTTTVRSTINQYFFSLSPT